MQDIKRHSEVGSDCDGRLVFDHDGPCEGDPTKYCKHYTCTSCDASVVVRCPQSKHTLKAIHLLDTAHQAR